MKKNLITFLSLLVLVLLFMVFSFAKKLSIDEKYLADFRNGYKVFALNLPKDIDFAGEKAPLYNFDIAESLDRELMINTYYQSQTLLMHKRANRWFPIIEPILIKNQIPLDFKYLALVESNLSNVVSPAGATGYWQFMEQTGKKYNLEINEEVDERYDVEKSTEAACKYLREAYQKLGSWTLAAASYNMGIEGVARQLQNQKQNNYYKLYLNQETARYVFRILAIKEILMHPKSYGYHFRKKDVYEPIPTNKLSIDSGITNLSDFALNQGINLKMIKLFNPWLRKNYLSNKTKKTYTIAIPIAEFATYENLENSFSNGSTYHSGDSSLYYSTEGIESDTSSNNN